MFTTFMFYEEGTLTNPNGILYRFESRDDLPIQLDIQKKDLALGVDWEEDDVRGMLESLARLGVINLNVSMDELVENLKGEIIYFNKNLSLYCNLNLDILKLESEKIEISSFDITQKGMSIGECLNILPEFLLNFGEGLEEKGTLCWVGGMGFLEHGFYSKHSFERICSAYAQLEHLGYILDNFDVSKVEEGFRESLKVTLEGLVFPVREYELEFGSLSGESEFRSHLMEHMKLLPQILSRPYNFVVEVKTPVILKIKVPSKYERFVSDFNVEFGKVNRRYNTLCKGSVYFEEIWWTVSSQRKQRLSSEVEDGVIFSNYLFELEIHPGYNEI